MEKRNNDGNRIMFEELSDFVVMRKYVVLATISLKNGTPLPPTITGIFSTDVLDEIGELYTAINEARKKDG